MAASTIIDADGERVFVIGDLHGCVEEPKLLLRHLEQKEALGDADLVVFLGDYIDRGPESREVVDLMLEFRAKFPKTRFLMGNHEDMLMDFLGFGGTLGESYLYNGGIETIQSYGMTVFSPPDEMVKALPPDHLKFFIHLDRIVRVSDFVCVHAGINPLRELESQNDGDVLWIRNEFLHNVHNMKYTVVFGHTPHQEMFVHLPYKVGLDTGLVFGNKLSCLELHSGKVYQVIRNGAQVLCTKLDMSLRVF